MSRRWHARAAGDSVRALRDDLRDRETREDEPQSHAVAKGSGRGRGDGRSGNGRGPSENDRLYRPLARGKKGNPWKRPDAASVSRSSISPSASSGISGLAMLQSPLVTGAGHLGAKYAAAECPAPKVYAAIATATRHRACKRRHIFGILRQRISVR